MSMFGSVLVASVLLVLNLTAASSPIWNVAVDSRTTAEWMAESSGRVYALQNGDAVAIETAHGGTLWRAHVQADGAPAYLRGILAVPVSRGLGFLDAASGRTRGLLALSGSVAVVAGQSSFVAVRF